MNRIAEAAATSFLCCPSLPFNQEYTNKLIINSVKPCPAIRKKNLSSLVGVCVCVSSKSLFGSLVRIYPCQVAEYIRNCRLDDGRNWTMSCQKKWALKCFKVVQDGETWVNEFHFCCLKICKPIIKCCHLSTNISKKKSLM